MFLKQVKSIRFLEKNFDKGFFQRSDGLQQKEI